MKTIKYILVASLFFIGFSSCKLKLKTAKTEINLEEQKPREKKKILFYSYRLEAGGIGRSFFTLLKHLDYSKYEVDVVFLTKFGTPIFEFKEMPKQVNLVYLYDPFFKSSKPSNSKLIQWLRAGDVFLSESLMKIYKNSNWLMYGWKLKNKKYDLEIALFSHALEFLIKSPLNSKKIMWAHMDLKNENELSRLKEVDYTIENMPKVEKIIAVSHQVKDSLLSIIPGIKDKIEVIYNPISLERTTSKSLKKVKEEKKHKDLQLLSLGRLHIQKGFDRLITACYRLKNEDKLDFCLWIVGEGPERINLTHQIQKLGLEGTVELLGFRENPFPYLKMADIFVLSSYHEAMAYVVLEAMLLNKPVVSTNVSGPGDLLKASLPEGTLVSKGEYGLLCENSPLGIYEGLKQMIRDKSLRESFINKNPDFSAFETENVVEQIERVFDEVMGR